MAQANDPVMHHRIGKWISSPPRWLRFLALAGVVLASASCFVALKASLEQAPPLRLVALRLFIAGVVLLALLPIMKVRLLPRPSLWPWLIVLGIGVTAFAYGTMAISLGFTGAGIASVLGNSQPLLAVALGVWLLGERLTVARLVALVLGFGGVVMVAFPATVGLAMNGEAGPLMGPLIALASSAGLVMASVIVKYVGADVSRLVLAAWPLVLASIPLFLLSLIVESEGDITWSLHFAGLLLFLALPGTALLTLIWYWLLRHGDLGRLSLFFYTVPAAGLGLSWIFYEEAITLQEWGGIALILLAIAAILAEKMRTNRRARGSKS